ERAVRGLATLRHPCIVPLIDFGYLRYESKVSPYLVYEIVAGRPLDVWSREIAGHDGMGSRRLQVALKIADAIEKAHECKYMGNLGFQEQGILHGDIKPGNILVRDVDDHPMVLDFMIPDLQRLIGGRDDLTYWCKKENGTYWYHLPLTADFGTPGYMSPEQAVDGIVSPASDAYSLGQTFLRLFWPVDLMSRTPIPFPLDYDALRYEAAKDGSADRIENALAILTAHMTAAQPENRPQRMSDVSERLRAIEQGTVAPATTSFTAWVAELIMKHLRLR
ncbi:MAG: hypothetical protein JO139_11660, partial [Alphaproteobacteria bacterium]|nr:hypothetical protein [Alphaproteobacteria bacterium]